MSDSPDVAGGLGPAVNAPGLPGPAFVVDVPVGRSAGGAAPGGLDPLSEGRPEDRRDDSGAGGLEPGADAGGGTEGSAGGASGDSAVRSGRRRRGTRGGKNRRKSPARAPATEGEAPAGVFGEALVGTDPDERDLDSDVRTDTDADVRTDPDADVWTDADGDAGEDVRVGPARSRDAEVETTGPAPAGDRAEYERRPGDLPDRPGEGVPSKEAAARATVLPARPRIGDVRPQNGAVIPRDPVGRAAFPATDRRPDGDPAKAPSRRRRRSGPADAGSAGDAPGDLSGDALPGDALSGDALSGDVDPEVAERRRGRERKGRPVGRYLMAVHVHERATQIAVLEGRALIEHYVSRPADNIGEIHGNVYLGRVQNVLPGMEAAFIDIGTPKNAVLYRGDIQIDTSDIEGAADASSGKSALRIEQMLRNGQTIVCQVTKNPIGTKGARLTQEISLPGRFVVLIPNSETYGISKRLGDEERRRLRRVLDDVRPPGHGLIVRTAAEGATADELGRDVAMLLRQWQAIEEKARRAKAPALLYGEPDLAVRVIREEFNRNYRGVIIDDPDLFREVRDYVEGISPELVDRIELYDTTTEPLPLHEKFHVHEQLHKALDRKVWLPSGGSIIIERTEALTVVDVNTGKNVGSTNLEETVFRNNLEAAEEIARQLRLRDIGGIIVIDFIDMEIRANREEVVRHFRDVLGRDKTRTQVFDISELGLVEMTRKRISEGLVESLSTACPTCGGRGFVLDDELLA